MLNYYRKVKMGKKMKERERILETIAAMSKSISYAINLHESLKTALQDMPEDKANIYSMVIDNTRMLEQIQTDYLETIKTLAKVIDANDTCTRGHCNKVMKYSVTICGSLKIAERDIGMIKTASLLHDIGKVGIDLGILKKKGPFDEDDWRKIRMHPEIGARIIGQVGFLNEIVPIIKYHHANFDGGGYPDSERRNGHIPLGARVIAVADAYDAITSNRPYRKAMSKEEAVKELKRCSGSQFDPKVVNAFLVAKLI